MCCPRCTRKPVCDHCDHRGGSNNGGAARGTAAACLHCRNAADGPAHTIRLARLVPRMRHAEIRRDLSVHNAVRGEGGLQSEQI